MATISEADLNDNTGILTGTFSRTKKSSAYVFRALRFKNVDTGVTYSIQKRNALSLLLSSAKPHFSDKNMDGEVFAYALPAGDYTIYSFEIVASGYNSSTTWNPKQVFSIPFTVSANKVNYLGAFHFTPSYGKNFFGFNVPDAGYFLLENELERDKGLITSVYSNLPVNDMNIVIPTTKDVFTPAIILPSEIKSKTPKSN